ncbi:unnamed protein product [Soboliphyme baturini]|uniref:ANF_receptor domain-containing protein n=1 Tax=Soboliphyme baturini TaxID=241478 RepID=A0A183IQC3_9BILA|nr:unnamed protein product [Soboliphyme baturini]
MNIVASYGFSSKKLNVHTAIHSLKEKDVRVIVGDFNVTFATIVFCEAYKQQMYGPQYVWVTSGYHDDRWWTKAKRNLSSCSEQQLLEALEGHFVVQFAVVRSDSKKTINGKEKNKLKFRTKSLKTFVLIDLQSKTAAAYQREYAQLCQAMSCNRSAYHGYVYDGIWAIALALEGIIVRYNRIGMRFRPSGRFFNRTLSNKSWERSLMTSLNRLQFEGVTGRMRFEKHARMGKITVAQFQNQVYVPVGEYDTAESMFSIEEEAILWQGMAFDDTD